jgi:phosphoglycolate phosphatase
MSGIIFDLDGTLADTLPDIADAVNEGLRAFGLAERSPGEVRRWIGEGMPTLCGRALAAAGAGDRIPLAGLITAVTSAYHDRRLNKTAPFPGIRELLDELALREIPMGVLSNKPHEHTVPMVEALFDRAGMPRFLAVEGYRQERRRKPDPRTALDIAAAMRVEPSEVILVGDSPTDMATAINAGLVPVGATWGYRSREELLEAGAAHLIDAPRDLLSLLSADRQP